MGPTALISGSQGTGCAQSEKMCVCVCACVCDFARAWSLFEFLVLCIPRLDSLQEEVGVKG